MAVVGSVSHADTKRLPIVYDDGALERSSPVKLPLDPACIACVTLVSSEGEKGAVGDVDAPDSIPRQWHVAGNAAPSVESSQLLHTYPGTSGNFVLRASDRFDYAQSSLAHSRTVAFVKRHLRGPTFDLEAIWEEHTLYEFGERSVAKTMGTMVPEPYVNVSRTNPAPSATSMDQLTVGTAAPASADNDGRNRPRRVDGILPGSLHFVR